MSLPKPVHIFCFLLLLVSCRRNQAAGEGNLADTVKMISRSNKVHKQTELEYRAELRDSSVYSICELSADSLVLIMRRGFLVGKAKTKGWKRFAKDIGGGIDQFTADDKGNWWLLQRWKGIHEASYSRIYRSADKGLTWKRYEFNTGIFFPYNISSAPHSPLEITTFSNNKIFRLVGNDPRHHWRFIKKLPDENWDADASSGKYFITRSDNKLYTKEHGKVDTILSFPEMGRLFQIEQIDDQLYITGENASDGGQWFMVISSNKVVSKQLFSNVDITKTYLNHLYVIAEGKPYRFKKGKLTLVYKVPEPVRCSE